jgi:hypothetical protein
LSLRMIIVGGLAAIALWGLFNLLDSLREPGLLRTQKSVAIKGCDTLDEHPDARRLCPQLHCEKALIDRKLADLRSQFKVTVDQARDGERLIGGELIGSDRYFACTLEHLKVQDARLVTASELDGLAALESR